ncbi:MAG: AAA family ATPase [Anaerolineae bacterium]|nr:AAA family ATPase [Anaerolineae bacterium]
MPMLEISLLGPLQVHLAGEVVSHFNTAKVQALLAYLAVESHHPQPREALAELFWPEQSEATARINLRQTLHRLRQIIPSAFWRITRQTIQFNLDSDYDLDVGDFTGLITACRRHPHFELGGCQPCLTRLHQAVRLYRGDFLADFSVADSANFEEWARLKREWLRREALQVLYQLAAHHEQQGDYEAAYEYAWRQVELDPLREEAHQQLMLILALSGRRSEALAQYDTCRQLLAEALEIEPEAETTVLYERIREGKLGKEARQPRRKGNRFSTIPLLRSAPTSRPPTSATPFVARGRELDQLDGFLDLALAGQGRVVFVTGGAGRGKTTLIQEFARRAQARYANLVTADGHCNAYLGTGDPYLPFREILSLLTGDVDATWMAGAISREYAHRLRTLTPHSIQVLVDKGPALIDSFISGSALVNRAATMAQGAGDAGWLSQLKGLVARHETGQDLTHFAQSDLFEQYSQVLQVLARHSPLLLMLDDLQWADAGSISLLFHLGMKLKGQRLLLVGSYRPYEVALGRPATGPEQKERHPLESVVNEFQRRFGRNQINLSRTESRQFVAAFLATEPNRLGLAFEEALFQQTKGHAMFTAEMLRGMQERGDLVQDAYGRWVEGPVLDWETLPARVEGVIKERIDRLPQPLQETLRVASIEGEVFTAEVVAQVQAMAAPYLVKQLSSVLDRHHGLVSSHSVQRLAHNGQPLSRYRFRHILFQRYVYSSLAKAERVYLHEAVGKTLEQLYGSRTEEVALELARHFQAAKLVKKAVEYLCQAGERARRLSAHQEAVTHFNNGLALLETLPDTPWRSQQELILLIALGNALVVSKGFMAPEVGQTYVRARTLCQQAASSDSGRGVEEMTQYYTVLLGLHQHYQMRGEFQTARELGEEFLALAHQQENEAALRAAHGAVGVTLFHLGELATAQDHLEQGFAFYNRQQYRSLPFASGVDPGVGYILFYGAVALWVRGYPDQALTRSHKALAIAQTLAQPFTLGLALYNAALIHQLRREKQAALEQAQATISLATEHNFPLWLATARIIEGWVWTEQGEVQAGINQIRQSLDAFRTSLGGATGREPGISQYLSVLAEVYGQVGLFEEGLGILDETLTTVNRGGDRVWVAELHRLKGELLLRMEGGRMKDEAKTEAEKCFWQAIEVARRQGAKALELRATVSLSRLWQAQEKREAAGPILAKIYNWFSEGFDTPDLKEARALIEGLP